MVSAASQRTDYKDPEPKQKQSKNCQQKEKANVREQFGTAAATELQQQPQEQQTIVKFKKKQT